MVFSYYYYYYFSCPYKSTRDKLVPSQDVPNPSSSRFPSPHDGISLPRVTHPFILTPKNYYRRELQTVNQSGVFLSLYIFPLHFIFIPFKPWRLGAITFRCRNTLAKYTVTNVNRGTTLELKLTQFIPREFQVLLITLPAMHVHGNILQSTVINVKLDEFNSRWICGRDILPRKYEMIRGDLIYSKVYKVHGELFRAIDYHVGENRIPVSHGELETKEEVLNSD